MKSEPAAGVASEPAGPPEKRQATRITRRLLKLSFVVMLPLILIPVLLPRKVSAKRLSGSKSAERSTKRESRVVREKQIQNVVDEFKIRMSIPDTVVVSIVEHNQLVVSVERTRDGTGAFSLLIEDDFLDGLTRDEIDAVVAHELGHVWIFTHHPFLQTEELANEIAIRVVREETLAVVYDKVWKRIGRKGDLVYLPTATAESSARDSR
jgi:hypothetical protein